MHPMRMNEKDICEHLSRQKNHTRELNIEIIIACIPHFQLKMCFPLLGSKEKVRNNNNNIESRQTTRSVSTFCCRFY